MILMLATMVTACSSGGGPTVPEGPDGSDLMALPIYANPTPEGMFSGMAALGVYQISLNTENLSYEITTERMASFVPTTHEVDLTTALTSAFCKDCFVIKGLTLSAGNNIMVEVGLKHPFPQVTGLPATKPQRADLHIFDVQGIVVIDGSKAFPDAGITLNPNFVLNADGYTTAFDSAIDSLGPAFSTTANCHPFKILSKGTYNTAADEIGNFDAFSLNGYPNPAGIMNPTGFNVLKGGKGWNNDYMLTQYELKPTGPTSDFFFVITCAYGQAGKRLGTALQQRDNPVYLLPAFSKPEAWNVDVEVENNALADNDNTSTAEIVIRACDWQDAYAAAVPNPTFDPAVDQAVPRNTVFKASDIGLVEIEIPGLLTNPVDSSTVTPSGNGSYLNPKTYRIVVNNETFASEISGDEPQFWGLAAVRDNLNGTTNPTGGIKRGLGPTDAFAISDYTTYQVFPISIYPPNDRPTPVITVTYPAGPPYNLVSGDTVDVDGLASFDTGDDGIPGGDIVAYEWDFDYDPVTEIFALPTDPEYWTDPVALVAATPPLWALDNPTALPVSKYIGMRVTDGSLGAAKEVAYVEIIVGPNQPPNADLGVAFYGTDFPIAPYTFYEGERITLKPGPGCSDDGAITTYQYDLSYDGSLFIVGPANTSGAPVMTPPQTAGPIDMAIRVIDNGIPNLNDIDFKTITVLGPAVDEPIQSSDFDGTGIDTTSVGYHALAEGDNTIMCVWTQNGNGSDIYYAVYDKGTLAWSAPAVLNTTTLATQANAALCVDPATDTYYAAFKDSSGGSQQISVAIYDPIGLVWGNQNPVTTALPAESPDDPSICFVPGIPPIIAVAYSVTDTVPDPDEREIRVQTSPDGLDWTAPAITVNTSSTNNRTDPVICYHPNLVNPQIGVAWDDLRGGSNYEIRFNYAPTATMVFQAPDIQVASAAGSLNDPSLTSDGNTWMMSFDNLSATSDINFTSSTLGTAGSWSPPVDITDSTDSQHNNSGICVDGPGNIYITCRDSRETGIALQSDIYVFKKPFGSPTWIRGVKANDRSGNENNLNASILGLSTGGFVVMYNFETPGSHLVYVAHSDAY
jgi:hypothetical protein